MDERRKKAEKPTGTKQKTLGDKLKNETSSGEAMRKKLRHGKADNTLTREEAKKLQKVKKQGRRKMYAETVVSAQVHHKISQQEYEQGMSAQAAMQTAFNNAQLRDIEKYYEEKAKTLLSAFDKMGKKWESGTKYDGDYWWVYLYGKETAYGNDCTFGKSDYYSKVIEFEDIDLGETK